MVATSEEGPSQQPGPGIFTSLLNSTTSLWYTMSLGARRFVDFVQGGSVSQNTPIWLLGTYYGIHNQDKDSVGLLPEVYEAFLHDLKSRVWCTYRRDFPFLGPEKLTSDMGWGCTLRSGQMLLAEALLRHTVGRTWLRRLNQPSPSNPSSIKTAEQASPGGDPAQAGAVGGAVSGDADAAAAGASNTGGSGSEAASRAPQAAAVEDPALLRVLSLFLDTPDSALSIHQICQAGQGLGVVPGKWLGPWALCKGLDVAVNAAQPLGLRLHVVADPGGGAPALDVVRVRALLQEPEGAQAQEGEGSGGREEHTSAAAAAVEGPVAPEAAGEAAAEAVEGPQEVAEQEAGAQGVEVTGAGPLGESAEQQEAGFAGQQGPEAGQPAEAAGSGDAAQAEEHKKGLLLLIPLTLGVGKANPLYFPQLQEVLQYPQSVGIVGGRPSSSLYFLGYQADNLLYLDPHDPQATGALPTVAPTYFCHTPRAMPIASIDPSLAIGFYCGSLGELEDLCSRLAALAKKHRSAPMLTVSYEPLPVGCGHMGSAVGSAHGEDAELGSDELFSEEAEEVVVEGEGAEGQGQGQGCAGGGKQEEGGHHQGKQERQSAAAVAGGGGGQREGGGRGPGSPPQGSGKSPGQGKRQGSLSKEAAGDWELV